MEWDDLHRSEDVQQLMAQGTLQQGSATYSIARQAIDLGFATLSDRQRFIYEQVIAATLKSTPSFEFRCAAQSHPLPTECERFEVDRH